MTLPVVPSRPEFNLPQGLLGGAEFDAFEPLARIGAIGTFTRQGRLLYGTSFEAGLAGWSFGLATDVMIDTTRPFHGANCMKILPPVASPFVNTVSKRFPMIYHAMYGVEILASMDAAATGWMLSVGAVSPKLGLTPEFQVWYDRGAATLSYENSGGTLSVFATGVPELRSISADITPIWFVAKMVFNLDPTALGYHAFILNDAIYDMRALSFKNSAPANLNPRLTLQIGAIDTTGARHPVYYDCFLLTTDEPTYVG